MKNKNFKNKIIIITGSNGVLGSCLARALKNSVKKLILVDKDDLTASHVSSNFMTNFVVSLICNPVLCIVPFLLSKMLQLIVVLIQ